MTPENTDALYSTQSPLYHAINSGRYERQRMIRQYQEQFSCRLAVMFDVIFPHSVPLFEELMYDISPDTDLHLILESPGGNGEVAVRLVRAALARCRELTIIVPSIAKSAATLMALGAHHILMGPSSDLGPIDTQFITENGLISAKSTIAAFDDAASRVKEVPDTFPFYASLLDDVTATMVQEARSALASDHDILTEALKSRLDRSDTEVSRLTDTLTGLLIDRPANHSALFSVADASSAGLPVMSADISGNQWQQIWRLWTKYHVIGPPVYEGVHVSHTNTPQIRQYDSSLGNK